MKKNTALSKKLETFPTSTGVYLMKDEKNKVIYVGKAKNLRNRVKSYFQSSRDERYFINFLVKRVADVDFVLTDTEKEAIILENNLIKQFKPRFNINLRDDKTFVSIKLDISKKYPYPVIVRQIKSVCPSVGRESKKDGVLYFGPYSSTRAVRDTLRYVNNLFPIRKCSDNVFKGRTRPCLYHQIGKCAAPCCDLVDEESEARRYERAANVRDRIYAIEKTVEKQKIHTMDFIDRDVFGYYREGRLECRKYPPSSGAPLD